uniref:Inactive serine protease 35 n=1 Tax=Myripristis murdjan TaxID=586833 RepID=A0A668ARP0_9TELE
ISMISILGSSFYLMEVFLFLSLSGMVYSWSRRSLPVLLDRHTELLNTPLFKGLEEDEERGRAETLCGIECQSALPPMSQPEQERILGYETMYANGTRTQTEITLQGFNNTAARTPARTSAHIRKKRQVYGADGRFVISDSQFITNYPFSSAVRLSTGCSGVLVSPKHVLTAAHCVHDGRDYLGGVRKLKVGLLKERSLNRIRRSAEAKKQPVFRWSRVKQMHIPKGWIHTDSSANSVSPDYDYALLVLKRPVKQKHMELGVAPSPKSLARIHFSSYDADKSLLDGSGDEKVVYRFCSVTEESNDLMYQHCDAQRGATGAGVYIRLRQELGGRKGKWQRRVIGVFSGHQWVELEEGKEVDFNVAVRITPPKYAQICHWIHGDPSLCREV